MNYEKLLIKNQSKNFSIGIKSIIIFLLFIGMFLIFILQTSKKVTQEHRKMALSEYINIGENLSKSIVKLKVHNEPIYKTILQNSNLQIKIEENLEIIKTDFIRYIYILYKDENGKYRFLADASKGSEKALINQKFDLPSQQWQDAVNQKNPTILKEESTEEVGATCIIPVVANEKIEVILIFDIGLKKIQTVEKVASFIKNVVLVFVILISLLIIYLYLHKRYFQNFKQKFYLDPLTGIYGRQFYEHIKDIFNVEGYHFILIDADHFKKINDSYGHDMGDAVLKELANRIKLATRENEDILMRIGGEEFLLLSKIDRKDLHNSGVIKLIERISNIIKEKPISYKNNSVTITVSMGAFLKTDKKTTFAEAFKAADVALYNAKTNGRNRYEIY